MRLKWIPLIFAFAALALGQAAQAAPETEAEDGRVVTLGKSKLTFYGFLRLDAVLDSDRPNNIQIPGFILSPDLLPPQGPAAGERDFTMHPRLTRFGLDLEAPPITGLGNPQLSGRLEIDFYNLPVSPTSLNSNSREFLRLRHAWAKLDWGTFSLLAGQREDVISPLFPTVNNDLVMWGAGNLGDRRPQLRPELKSGRVTLTGMIGVTGAVDSQNLEGAANNFFDGEASGVPTLQVRAGYTFDGPASGKKSAVGVWAHWARERLDVDTTFPNGEDEFTSDCVGADLSLLLHPKLWIKSEIWSGKNLDDVRGGIFQGVIGGEEIEARGGWAEVGFPLGWWTPSVGFSIDDPDDEHLPVLTATTNPGQDKNTIWYVANRMRWGAFEVGADYLHWETRYAGSGVRDGVDHRVNSFVAYHF